MLLFAPLFCLPALVQPVGMPAPQETEIAKVLDDWHLAAAQADEARYFGHLAPEAVFLGTDATERWDKQAFQAFAHPFFAKGKAWSFKAVRRTICVAAQGSVAWFEEDLDTPNMGPCRGSGVLERRHNVWKLLQYNLSVPIPNPLMPDFKKRIEAHLKSGK